MTAGGQTVRASAERERRPVLGVARRRRQLRRGHALHLSACTRWDRSCSARPHRLSDGAGEVGAAAVPRVHGAGARRAVVWTVLRNAPPLPFLPESVHGQPILALALLYVGDPDQGEALVEPLHHLGTPVGAFVGVQPYTAWQQAFDPLLAPGARNYWKSHNFTQLDDELLDVVLRYAASQPSPECEIFLAALGGADAARARRGRLRPSRDPLRDERSRPLGGCGRRPALYRLGARLLRRRRSPSPAAAST